MLSEQKMGSQVRNEAQNRVMEAYTHSSGGRLLLFILKYIYYQEENDIGGYPITYSTNI